MFVDVASSKSCDFDDVHESILSRPTIRGGGDIIGGRWWTMVRCHDHRPTCENTISGPIFPGWLFAFHHHSPRRPHSSFSCHSGRTAAALRIKSLLAGLGSLCPVKRPEQTLISTVTTSSATTTTAMTTMTDVTGSFIFTQL